MGEPPRRTLTSTSQASENQGGGSSILPWVTTKSTTCVLASPVCHQNPSTGPIDALE
jgi:hypothetical protein